eukprot:GHVT01053611.1.p1 GENE.GHVT01053611.1~~GHVT01053611.1.p1  ORF type:complete len:358 (+),score=55.72 GHVT01053611.1:105-1178(+)
MATNMSIPQHPVEDASAYFSKRNEGADDFNVDEIKSLLCRKQFTGEKAIELEKKVGVLRYYDKIIFCEPDLKKAYDALDVILQELLQRTAKRIKTFAQAQKDALQSMEVKVPGGVAGHELVPLRRAGCYAPGGAYPLASTVLMTVVTAKVAGVFAVWVACPKPTNFICAAAHVAGADGLVALGGASAIGIFAFGGTLPYFRNRFSDQTYTFNACDVIVGPGNKFVTAAKAIVASQGVAIDMLAGPSELLVVADESAKPNVIAADLLAQAEHAPDARVGLICFSSALKGAVEKEIHRQLPALASAFVARQALTSAYCFVVDNFEQAAEVANYAAAEHLEVPEHNSYYDWVTTWHNHNN